MRPLCLVALLACLSACRSAETPVLLEPVPEPDLTSASAPVRRQVSDQYRELIARAEDASRPASERADAYGRIGQVLMALRLSVSGEAALRNANRLAPQDPRWLHYLAHLRRFAGDADAASTLFEDVIRLQPDNVAALLWLGRVHLSAGRAEMAEPHFQRALSLAASSPPAIASAQVGLGDTALARKDTAAAIQHFEAALAAEPEATMLHYRLAMAYRAKGDLIRAQAHLSRRGELDVEPPDPLMEELRLLIHTPVLFLRRGLLALENGAVKEAVSHFRRGLELEPDDPELIRNLTFNLGIALFRARDLDAAEARFRDGIKHEPTYAGNHFGLGAIAASRDRLDEAVSHFETALRHDPAHVEARFALAETLVDMNRAARALPLYERLIADAPALPDPKLGYAGALVQLGRTRQARAHLLTALGQHPGDLRFVTFLRQLDAAAPGGLDTPPTPGPSPQSR